MRLKEISPMIRTKNLPETIAFYEQQLGFICTVYSEEWGWAALRRDDTELMIAGMREDDPPAPVFTGSIYFRLDEGVDELWDELKQKVRVGYELETFTFGMREFAVYDNNGYLLQFGQKAC